jgi:uncharacterized protein YjgD (DUF1641 family)
MEQPTQTHTNGAVSLEQRLDNPETAQALNRLLDRLDTIEEAVAKLDVALTQGPAMLAMMTDMADDVYRQAEDEGVNLDERLQLMLQLTERLTAPRTVEVLTQLMDRMDELEQLIELADQAPGFAAMMVDTFDSLHQRAVEAGHDPERLARRSLTALTTLLESGVLDPEAIEIVGKAGDALVDCRCQEETPEVGLFGLLGAMRDPDTRRALGFLTEFGKRFGQKLDE